MLALSPGSITRTAMLEQRIQLGESLFLHRKPRVKLLTQTTVTVLRKHGSDHSDSSLLNEAPDPRRLWIPRTRRWLLSLHISSAHNLGPALVVSHGVDSTIADLIESAELWAQLGYEASHVRCHKLEHIGADEIWKIDFEIHSHKDFDPQSWSPPSIVSWDLRSVHLRLHFTRGHLLGDDKDEWTTSGELTRAPDKRAIRGWDQSSQNQASMAEAGPAQFQEQAFSGPHLTASVSQSDPHRSTPQKRLEDVSLGANELTALIDAGLRSSICPKSTRLAAGIKCLSDQDNWGLCDLAPAVFIPNHLQRLGEQSKLVPGISNLLSTFLKPARSATPQPPSRQSSLLDLTRVSREIDQANQIQLDLWYTLNSSTRDHASARRLRPLRRLEVVKLSDPMLDFPHAFDTSDLAATEPEVGGGCDFDSDPTSDLDAVGTEDLYNICMDLDDPGNTSSKTSITKSVECGHISTGEPLRGVSSKSPGQRLGGFDDFPFEEQGACPLQHQSRKSSNSLSHMSDVSMLLACEPPITDSPVSRQPQVIGGSQWLTQNVIRMHPLRQQQHENHTVDILDSARTRRSLYERPEPSWWSDTSDASELPLEAYRHHDTKAHFDDICLASYSPSSVDEEELAQDYFDILYDSEVEEECISYRTLPMSTRQTREGSNGSLAEVIGNEHLLWHMWKRRASVAPRGEEDVTDMKTLFATDPDMKLFSSRWDLDPSDISSSSNEDPMLHETTYNIPPRNKPSTPVTPSSERRSYFTPTRSSSSSGYVGRSGADPSRRSSLIKRFTWGGRHNSPQTPSMDVSKHDQRTMEVKRRKTLDDYETEDREASNDDSSEMLF